MLRHREQDLDIIAHLLSVQATAMHVSQTWETVPGNWKGVNIFRPLCCLFILTGNTYKLIPAVNVATFSSRTDRCFT